jgi:DNA-binding transcriptional LysR family regulator
MDLKQLERFVIVAEMGNIGLAAARLGLSQPALTRSLHMLEETVGGALFDRLPRGVRLTAVGQALLPQARLVLADRARLAATIAAFKGLSGGSVVFGASPNLVETLGMDAVLAFARQHPRVGVTIHVGAFAELARGLREGDLDLALSTVGSETVPPELTFEPLFEQMMSIVARGGHPLAGADMVTFAELSTRDWIVTNGAAAIAGLNRTFEAHGATPPFFAIRCQSLNLQKKLLLGGDYLAIMDQAFIRAELETGAIRVLKTQSEGVLLRSGLLYRAEDARTPAANALARCVRGGMAQKPKR